MSEAAPEETPRKARLSRRTWLIAGGVAVTAGVLWYLYRSRQNAAAAAAPPPATADTSGAVDQAGELSVIQTELETLLADEGGEPASSTWNDTPGTIDTPPPPGSTPLPAPGGFSITPVAGGAHVGWGTVPGAGVYQLVIAGAGGKGTGASHYDHTAPQTHAQVTLSPGKYTGKVRAGKSAADVHGTWTAGKAFTVKGKSGGSSGGGGEGED